MATVKSLEDMLSSEVDESDVAALVGSLESQLSSSSIQISSQGVNTSSVTVNHVNNSSLVDCNVTRLLDGAKQGVIAASPAVSLINVGKSTIVSTPVADANAASVASTSSNVIVTLPGALPASGYITQVTGPPQQTFFTPVVSVSRQSNTPEIKSPFSTQSQVNPTCTINTRSKTAAASVPNGGTVNLLGVRQASMGAIYDLANVASQQSPMQTSNTIITTSIPTPPQVTNGKQVIAVKSQVEPKQPLEKGKAGVNTRSQDIQPTTVVQQVANNIVQVTTNPTVVSKSHVTSSQAVSVVSQVVSNPSILTPGVQIMNVGPRLGLAAGQKTLAPRVVLATNPIRIAPQILTARAGVSGQGTITLSPGMVRGAVILKAENGQLQVMNLAGSSGSAIPGATTYRLSSLPPGATGVRAVTPQHIVSVPVSTGGLKTSATVTTTAQTLVGTILQGSTPLSGVNSRLSSPTTVKSGVIKVLNNVVQTGVNGSLTAPLSVQTTSANTQPNTPTQMSPNTAKQKCKNFLSTLIRLADEQPAAVAKSVRNLIQGIIDGTMQAEEFTSKLQKELNSAPQPYLVPFLKKNLPYLRHSLITKELTIEGVRPPPPSAIILPHPHASNLTHLQLGQKRPLLQPTTQVRLMTNSGSPLTTQLITQNTTTLNQRFAGQLRSTVPNNQSKSILVGKTLVGSSVAAASPATVTALQSKFPFTAKPAFISSAKDQGKRAFSSLREDDDINDVAAMGGVNLIEESQKILASNAEIVGTQIRSCKDESFLFSSALEKKIRLIARKLGIEEVSPDVINLISHASQTRLKTMIEKLSIISEHRMENIKNDNRYEVVQDVRSQIKFIEELDRLEKRRHEEQEREILLRAAKSRSKLEDPEQLKLKQKAKEMQRAELEELRHREANNTALAAIGPRKKAKLDNSLSSSNQGLSSQFTGSSKFQLRPRVKRVNMRDLLCLMEQEKDTIRKSVLYKSYAK
ncbi:transcription initiation factor TFIID subunit 4 [Parasteatoda tepidariorum]|nr:transcription initiation factor TFIID subunit 4-like [Parasteatoda tepidariorum]